MEKQNHVIASFILYTWALRLSKADVYLVLTVEGRRHNNLGLWKGREKYSQAGLCEPGGELSHGSLCATHRRQRLIVAMSIEISRNNGARQDDCIVACESIPVLAPAGACERFEKSLLPSPRITSCRADYGCSQQRAIIPPI